MRSRTIISIVAVVMAIGLLIVAAAYFMLRGMDLGAFRPEIIAKVKAVTGRDLAITGDLEVALHEGLAIRAKGLALSNAAWGSRPEMLALDRAEAYLALLPLLFGEVRVSRIDLHGVDLILETDASGRGNWDFGRAPGDGTHAAMPSVSIESGQLTWRNGRRPDAGPWVFTGLEIDAEVAHGALRLKANARLQDEALALSGRLPTLQALSSGSPEDLELRLRLGQAEVSGSGTLQQAAWGIAPKLRLRVAGLDLATVGRLAGRPQPVLPTLAVAFDLSREADAWRIDNLDASAGRSDLRGDLHLAIGSGRPRVSAHLASRRLDLTELYTLPSSADGDAVDAAPVTWKPWLDSLQTLDGTLQLRVAEMVSWDFDLADVQVDGQLEAGRLSLKPIRAGIAGSERAEGRFVLDAGGDNPDWSLALKLRKLPAGVLLGPTRASLIEAPLDLDLRLRTIGRDLPQVVGNLAGDARLLVGAGRARTQRIDALVGGSSTLTGQLLVRGSEDAQLNCAVADFAIQQGVATANVLLIDSAVSTVRGDGRIDLGARQIDLTFTPRAKTPTLSVAVPVHVRGPIRKPQFIADRKATLGKLMGVAGLFVYPPAALVALSDLGDLSGSANPCIELVHGNRAPDASGVDAGKGQEAGDGVVQGLGRGLKKLFGQ